MTHRILIVDDEPNLVLSVERFRPDLVLLDVMMPRRDGYEVCQTLRATGWRDLKIVMDTAKTGSARFWETDPLAVAVLGALAAGGLATGLVRFLRHRHAESTADDLRLEVESERNRLADLMARLGVAVVVCNAYDRILLYNDTARSLVADPALLGLGRTVFGLVDRGLLAHDRERIAAGSPAYTATTLHRGRMLRVHVAPAQESPHPPAGSLLEFPHLGETDRRRLLEVVGEESERLGRQLGQAATDVRPAEDHGLDEISAADLAALLGDRLRRGAVARSSPSPCSTPRPPAWTRREATGSCPWARCAWSTAASCARRPTSSW